jgi:hypothetical protein
MADQTAPLTRAAKGAANVGFDLAVLGLCGYGLLYFSYKFYSPAQGGTDFFYYYSMYQHPLDFHVTRAPFVFRQVSAVSTWALVKLGVYVPEAISFHAARFDQRIFFAAMASNFLWLIGASWLTGRIVEVIAKVRGGAWPLAGSLFCLLSFHVQSTVITGLTEGASWMLMAGALLAFLTRRILVLAAILALSVLQRETISVAMAAISLAFIAIDAKSRPFSYKVLAISVACFVAYVAMRRLSGVAGHETQMQPGAILASLRSFRFTQDILFQGLLSQSTLFLALLASAWPGAKPRWDLLVALLAAFAVLWVGGVGAQLGSSVGHICAILTPGFAALAGAVFVTRDETSTTLRVAQGG